MMRSPSAIMPKSLMASPRPRSNFVLILSSIQMMLGRVLECHGNLRRGPTSFVWKSPTMRRKKPVVFATILVLLVLAAQGVVVRGAGGRIEGKVTDPKGAA